MIAVQVEDDDCGSPILKEEIDEALQELKQNKPLGVDKNPREILQKGEYKLMKICKNHPLQINESHFYEWGNANKR